MHIAGSHARLMRSRSAAENTAHVQAEAAKVCEGVSLGAFGSVTRLRCRGWNQLTATTHVYLLAWPLRQKRRGLPAHIPAHFTHQAAEVDNRILQQQVAVATAQLHALEKVCVRGTQGSMPSVHSRDVRPATNFPKLVWDASTPAMHHPAPMDWDASIHRPSARQSVSWRGPSTSWATRSDTGTRWKRRTLWRRPS